MAPPRRVAPCPYCGTSLVLADCPIVATNFDATVGGFAGPRNGDSEPVAKPYSGAPALGGHFGRPVLWRPVERVRVYGAKARLKRGITSLMEDPRDRFVAVRDFAPEDLPARACLQCGEPLPDDIGERPILTIGIVGTTSAGKSHFLASLIRDGAQRQGLRPWGIEEFMLDETSADAYRQKYQAFFHDHVVFEGTMPGAAHEVRKHPLAVRTALDPDTPVTLLFHDIAGETLLQRGQRARHASFLTRAAALIFLIDPLMIEPIRERLKGGFGNGRYYNQADLVNACISDLGAQRASTTPIAIAVSKSDLIETALPGQRFVFRRTPSRNPETAMREMNSVDGEVRNLLGAAGALDLLAAAERPGRGPLIRFHAVAPIGREPAASSGQGRAAVSEIAPLRCLDPLIHILTSLGRRDEAAAR